MSRVSVVFLAFWFALNSFSATQTIQADSGPNLIAVNLKVGENRLTDLFPNVPVGTLIFKFDHSAGWSAAQMYPSGWSHPNLQILPWGGCSMYLPANTSINVTLEGEIIPVPRPDYIALGQGIEQVYTGWNLVSLGLVNTRSASLVLTFNKNTMTYNSYRWDDLDISWLPVLPSTPQAVWVYGSGLAHPNGSFANTNTAVYFNNYAPAFGIDSPFYTPNCEHRSGLTVQLLQHPEGGGPATPFGEPVTTSTAFPGYIEPSADLVRYLAPNRNYSVRYEGSQSWGETSPFTVAPTGGALPPLFPMGTHIGPTIPVFHTQPQSASFRPEDDVELHAIFYDALVMNPQVTLNVPYQWQKQTSAGQWVDIPNATTNTLNFENIQAADAGNYRLRATYNCEPLYSRTASLSVIAPLVASQLQASGKVRLQVTLPVTTKAVVQTSTDLKNWSDAITIDTATNAWTGEVNLEADAKFYRVVEVP